LGFKRSVEIFEPDSTGLLPSTNIKGKEQISINTIDERDDWTYECEKGEMHRGREQTGREEHKGKTETPEINSMLTDLLPDLWLSTRHPLEGNPGSVGADDASDEHGEPTES
jgi:hypothetical protein